MPKTLETPEARATLARLGPFLQSLSQLCRKHGFGLRTACGEDTLTVFTVQNDTVNTEYEGLSVEPSGALQLTNYPGGTLVLKPDSAHATIHAEKVLLTYHYHQDNPLTLKSVREWEGYLVEVSLESGPGQDRVVIGCLYPITRTTSAVGKILVENQKVKVLKVLVD